MKEKLNVLLVCGAGASSSFMAAKMRVAARDRGIDITISARSEGEVSNYISSIDAVMVGPHLEGSFESLKQTYGNRIAVILMEKDYYSSLDGEKALDHLFSEIDKTKGEKKNMAKHNVLLVCGSGASSGFMAANIRKAAAARGIEISVNARSEATVEDYVEEIDCLMIGPHLAHLKDEMEERCEGYDVKVGVIDKAAYSRLNGEAALDQILALFGE